MAPPGCKPRNVPKERSKTKVQKGKQVLAEQMGTARTSGNVWMGWRCTRMCDGMKADASNSRERAGYLRYSVHQSTNGT